MHSALFIFQLPKLLSNFSGSQEITIYSYVICIVIGTIVAAVYTLWNSKIGFETAKLSNTFFYLIFVAGFLGGKFFYYMQNPMLYIDNPALLFDNFSGGFVFYGSVITIIPSIIWYLKSEKSKF
ncbi:Prolipoprotein diacylglyceryl transferase [Kordia antarctica]|uniref:Prolipoprotein diacylglyceryl transferase n=1 Tax=Kordia antarctica TaxID=1218801 RepID=A0A7L4ZDL1_9FLAO|nr:prolipoprotein diacylglyceryl transferase family protein [Kordia antarctica]QHI34888.1 Prolipoprotein diacylglyceryl transferase [Kordia antarctica]